ncbi:general L-amino acid transport system ATP-binding protein/glutamate/aspartate transport system ATP-binding protein [Azospirillum lipoferum]|nr:general L-amino acid transport system ATP-binding protein/glutamate/aspartate transport system ATP-binding protein [Azospirillum lipoferum]
MIALADQGMSMLCVTHEMGFAREVADRVVCMDRGRGVEDDTPDPFLANPASVREFLERVIHNHA